MDARLAAAGDAAAPRDPRLRSRQLSPLFPAAAAPRFTAEDFSARGGGAGGGLTLLGGTHRVGQGLSQGTYMYGLELRLLLPF